MCERCNNLIALYLTTTGASVNVMMMGTKVAGKV